MSENQNLNEETVLEEEVKTEETVCEENADKAVNEQTAPEPETDENSADSKKEKKASRKKSMNWRTESADRWQSLKTSVRERIKKKQRCLKPEQNPLSKRFFL